MNHSKAHPKGAPMSTESLHVSQVLQPCTVLLSEKIFGCTQWQPTPVFLPGESQGRGAWWAAICGVTHSRTQLKRLSSKEVCGTLALP